MILRFLITMSSFSIVISVMLNFIHLFDPEYDFRYIIAMGVSVVVYVVCAKLYERGFR